MRLGFFPAVVSDLLRKKAHVWIHAVSVGEVLMVSGLIPSLKKKLPNDPIVLTTVTQTGYKIAVSKLKEDAVVLYAPIDFSWVVRKYIQILRPRIYVLAETEIWPNLLKALHQHKVPVVLINGRISEKSFRGYCKIRFFMKKILEAVSVFCMQSRMDAQRIESLGASPQKIMVVGNIKFDDVPAQTKFRLSDFGFHKNEMLWIAGSTHPGEEAIVLNIFKSLSTEFPDLRLVIAPRHIERTNEVVLFVKECGYNPIKLSQLSNAKSGQQSVVIIDTIGQLRSLYSLSKIVFVGKSLTGEGGQNIIEPAFSGNLIFVGPHTQNFTDIVQIFLEDRAVIQVQNADELEHKMREFLRDPDAMKQVGHAAWQVVQKYQGATKRTIEIIEAKLNEFP